MLTTGVAMATTKSDESLTIIVEETKNLLLRLNYLYQYRSNRIDITYALKLLLSSIVLNPVHLICIRIG